MNYGGFRVGYQEFKQFSYAKIDNFVQMMTDQKRKEEEDIKKAKKNKPSKPPLRVPGMYNS